MIDGLRSPKTSTLCRPWQYGAFYYKVVFNPKSIFNLNADLPLIVKLPNISRSRNRLIAQRHFQAVVAARVIVFLIPVMPRQFLPVYCTCVPCCQEAGNKSGKLFPNAIDGSVHQPHDPEPLLLPLAEDLPSVDDIVQGMSRQTNDIIAQYSLRSRD
jgi:hypothetical protein